MIIIDEWPEEEEEEDRFTKEKQEKLEFVQQIKWAGKY